MSYVSRDLTVVYTLGKGTFGDSGQNTLILPGHRVTARIAMAGAGYGAQATIRVYGLTQDKSNQLFNLGCDVRSIRSSNTVELRADGVRVYAGYTREAVQDYGEIPNSSVVIEGLGGLDLATIPAVPFSASGPQKATDILKALCASSNWSFSDGGVTALITDPYFSGSAKEQILAVCRAVSCEFDVSTQGALAVWPRGGKRAPAGDVLTIGPKTGLVGYPRVMASQIQFRSEFFPDIASRARVGDYIQIDSELLKPNISWQVTALALDLSAQLPGGSWFADITAIRVTQ